MIICFVGLISAGKGTAGQILTEMGYEEDSFAAPLKDALSAIFGWPREMLSGDTAKSRVFRETVDEWWSNKLNIPDFTPRKAMQFIGTDVFRKYFDDSLWILSLERRFHDRTNKNVVVTDGRFPNEIRLLKQLGATIIRIKKGQEPEWYETAYQQNTCDRTDIDKLSGVFIDLTTFLPKPYPGVKTGHPAFGMDEKYPEIHSSEWAWVGCPDIDIVIENDGTVEELHEKIKKVVSTG